YQPGPEIRRAAMAWMTDVRRVERGFRATADGEEAAALREGERERQAGRDLGSARRSVGARGAGMRRHDVPEQDALLEPELGEYAVDDRGARLGRPAARQLPFGGERDARD